MLPAEGANMRIDGAIWDGGTNMAAEPAQPSVRTPLRIIFRHMAGCPAIEARIREHVDRLERFHTCMTDCHVIVEAPPARRRKRALFDIKIDLTVPGKEISVSSDAARQEAHADVYVALRDAFDTVRRLLRRHEQQHCSNVRHDEMSPTGAAEQIDAASLKPPAKLQEP